MNFSIEPFLQYGVLGIIGFLFLKMASKMADSQMKQFELLISNLMQQKTEPIKDIKDSLTTVMQTVNNHNMHMTQACSDAVSKIDSELRDKRDLLQILMEMDERNKQLTVEYMNSLNAHKMILFEMKKNCKGISSKRQLGDILIQKGLITPQQLEEALQEQDSQIMQEIGIKPELPTPEQKENNKKPDKKIKDIR
jgi:ssRNA-specific RNase YbeY (16S rRNA maturation enzyme)